MVNTFIIVAFTKKSNAAAGGGIHPVHRNTAKRLPQGGILLIVSDFCQMLISKILIKKSAPVPVVLPATPFHRDMIYI